MLKSNLIANYFGQGWRTIMSLIFVPFYIKYLGIEAYGLIGVYAILQSCLTVFDVGMRPTIAREMARYKGGQHSAQSIWNLLRSIETLTIAIMIVISFGVWIVSGWLTKNWVSSKNLSDNVVENALILMGFVVALRLLENIYSNSIIGLQKQVLLNVIVSVIATIRGIGALAILVWISPTILAFFLWQGLISLIAVLSYGIIVYRLLPNIKARRFSQKALRSVWRFAVGITGITLLSLFLTQIDKLFLSKLLPLDEFGIYTLASVVAGTLNVITAPILTAFYPRFAELLAQGDEVALQNNYHLGAQLVTVIVGSTAVVLMIFADKLMLLWTGDPNLSKSVAPLLTVLACGNLLNRLAGIPYQMQLAFGWTSLGVKINVVSVLLLVPGIFIVVPKFGALGAAWLWVILNIGYVFIGVQLMYRRILIEEKKIWYIFDVIIPLLSVSAFAVISRNIMPDVNGNILNFIFLLIISILSIILAGLSAKSVRFYMLTYLRVIKIKYKTCGIGSKI